MLILLIIIATLLPYTVYLFELRRREMDFVERKKRLMSEKEKIEKKLFNIEKRFNELEDKLLLYERIYDISRRMQKVVSIKEIVDSFFEMVILESGFKRMAFFDSKFGLISYKNISSFEIKEFFPEKKRKKVFECNVGGEKLGWLVVDGEGKDDILFMLLNQFSLLYEKAKLYKEVEELSRTDGLTGVALRRYFMQRFQEEIIRAKRYGYIIGVLMIDIDNFKKYNDTYGHQVGDRVLKKVARNIKEAIDSSDFVGRYGGEEFSVFIVSKDKRKIIEKAEKIRRDIEDKTQVTVSIGVSFFPENAQDTRTLIEIADECLYMAKREGKNRVIFKRC